jgi:NAD(P)H-dependent FMN reductase
MLEISTSGTYRCNRPRRAAHFQRQSVVDLRDYPLPIYEQPSPPARTLRDYPTEPIARFGRVIDQADGYLIITSEYNHGNRPR